MMCFAHATKWRNCALCFNDNILLENGIFESVIPIWLESTDSQLELTQNILVVWIIFDKPTWVLVNKNW